MIKHIYIEIIKPKEYKTVKKQSEWRRNKYHTDEDVSSQYHRQMHIVPVNREYHTYRLNRTEQAKEYHQNKFEELGIEKQPKGRPRKYETKEEANQANLANIKRIYHEKKTTTSKVGRPLLSLEDKIEKIEEKHNMLLTKQG